MADTSEVSQQRSLRIGDTVLLFVREKFGYVYSELSSPAHNHVNVFKVNRERQKDPDFPNVAYATFKVIAPNKYKAQQQYREVQLAYERTTSDTKRGDFERKMQQAKKHKDAELRENNIEQSKRYGEKLLYGQGIQLVHVSSKKFISLSTEATSRLESNNLLVQLSKENSEGCIFKILPRYKVRSEGDQVRYGDQMKLESLKTAGQYLHCSNQTFGSSDILHDQHELNLSATETALTVVHHYCPFENDVPKAVRAGCCLRLFHRENESYVVAEGSFASNPPVREEVHCRQRRVDQKGHSLPSTSANTYWQIEKESDSRNGDVLLWGERCRLKHLTTRLYLTVQKIEGNWKVGLKRREFKEDDPRDLDTLFNFHSLLKEGDEVQLESYARIKHLLSDTWLHVDVDGCLYERQWVKEAQKKDTGGLEGLQWDSAKLMKLSTSHVMGDYDAFTLQEVEEPLLDKFNYVAGMVPVLHGYITHMSSDFRDLTTTEKVEPRVKAALAGLCQWLKEYKNERESKNKQKLLRNLMVLEQLMEILKMAKNITLTTSVKSICRECYGILKQYLKGESRKNENYLARFINVFQTQVGMELNAEEVLVEIVQDNFAIVSEMARSQMDYMIAQLNATKDPRFLNFLSSLCVCSNRPIPSTQNRILKELVVKFGENLFIRTVVSDDGSVMCTWEGWTEPININKLKENSRSFNFFEAQLHLFARLCKGNNPYAIEQICCAKGSRTGYMCFEEVFRCAQSKELSYVLRSRYVDLILVMFVAVGENRSFLDHLCYSFSYEMLEAHPYSSTGDDKATALTGVYNEHFAELSEWIKEIVDDKKVLVCDDQHIPHNEVLAKILDLLCHLVNYGYYDDQKDINAVLGPLIELLDGSTDISGHNVESTKDEFKMKGRMKMTKANSAAFAVKKKAMDVVGMFLKFKCYVQLQVFIYDFKLLNGGARRAIGERSDDQAALLRKLKHLMPPETEAKDTKVQPFCVLDKPELTLAARQRLRQISIMEGSINSEITKSTGRSDESQKTDKKNEKTGQVPVKELKNILLDLSMYECDDLVRHSLILLTGIHFLEHTLFTHAAHTQLLVASESITRHEMIESTLPRLRHLLSVDCDSNDLWSIVRMLETLCEGCTLLNDKEPHRENQLLLYNYGILSDILSYVLRKGTKQHGDMSSVDSDCYEGREETPGIKVFKNCFKLLQSLAFKNEMVQRRLFSRLSELLKIRMGVHDMAQVLTEIFSGGPDICLKVKEEDVESIFKLIAMSKDASTQAELMNALQALAKIEDYNLPVSRSQDLIIKYYCKYRDDLDHCDHCSHHSADQCRHIVGDGPENMHYRRRLLERATADESHRQLLLSLTDLLATCAEGDNLFIASVCQKIFSVKELIDIMCSKDLCPEVKRPFVRYLIHVYMYTNGERDSQEEAILAHGEDMWGYLEHVAELLRNFKIVLQKVPDQHRQQFRRGLVASVRQRTYSFSHRITPMTLTANTHNIPDMTGSDGKILPGFLEYFTQGIVLFLYVFYKFFFNLKTIESDKQRETELRVTGEISSALIDLGNVIVDYITNTAHLQQFRETLYHICTLKVETVQECLTDLRKLSYRVWHRCKDDSSSVDGYREVYRDQIKLNKRFRGFVRNYQLAYLGPNTAAHQIQSPAKNIAYNECGEELPLGPNFQELVKCYSTPPPPEETDGEKHKINPLAERLLAQLEISLASEDHLTEAEQQQQDMLDIRCLQVLRALIHNRIKSVDPEMKDSDAAEYRKWCIKKLHPVQEEIQGFRNAAKRVLPLLSHPNDAITNEVLSLLKALLFSGNEIVQEGLDFVKDTREEYLFVNLKKKLDNAAERYKESRRLQYQMESRREFDQKVGDTFGLDLTKRKVIDQRMPLAVQHPPDVVISMEDQQEAVVLVSARSVHPTLPRSGFSLERTVSIEMQSLKHVGLVSDQQLAGGADEMEMDPVSMLKPDSSTALVLEVIGLMCDGQRDTMQDYLREQPDNFRTINVVADVAVFLQTYTNQNYQMCPDNYKQIKEVLQALTEMCVGNARNQEVILNKHVVDCINRILLLKGAVPTTTKKRFSLFSRGAKRSVAGPKPESVMLLEVKLKAAELLEVMLERTSSDLSENIKKGLQVQLNKDALLQSMVYFRVMKSVDIVKEWDMDDDAERGMYRACHVLVTFMTPEEIEEKLHEDEKAQKSANEKEQKENEQIVERVHRRRCNILCCCSSDEKHQHSTDSATAMQTVWKECQKSSRSVEINYHSENGEILTKVHFSHYPKNLLREELVEKVRWNITRDSMEDKQRALVDLFEPLKKDLNHQEELKKNKLHFITVFGQTRHKLLILLTLILNVFVLVLFKVPPGRLQETASSGNGTNCSILPAVCPETVMWYERYLLYVLGSIHLFLSLWMVVEYYIVNYPHFRLPQFFYRLVKWMVKQLMASRCFKDKRKIKLITPKPTLLDVNIFGMRTVWVLVFLTCSILSLVWYGYFYCICALHIIVNNDILQRVLRAVTKNGVALIMVLILGIIVLFIFSVMSFAFLYNNFYQTDDGDLYCDTLLQCFVTVVRYGLIDNLGLIIPLDIENGGNTDERGRPPFYIAGWRLLLDVTFFILVTTIGLNIVFGIIVDAFSELRDEKSRIEEDQKSKCFVCDLPSHDFDRRRYKGFRDHVKKDHNMWNYVYYSNYLDSIDTSDHTAIQKYVYELIDENKSDFFPKEKALCLGGEEDQSDAQLEQIQEMIQDLLQRYRKKDVTKSADARKQEQRRWEENVLRPKRTVPPTQ